MFPRSATDLLSPKGLGRFQLAYDEKKRPIGWWEADREAAGLVQAYLHTLGYNLPKSIKVQTDPQHGPSITADGVFGQETFNAVVKFQKDNGLKADGMVGADTFDALARKLDKPRLASHGSYNAATFVHVRRTCRPGQLICPDPDE
jgi:hypothetical protein